MIVKRDVNVDLQTFNNWQYKTDREPLFKKWPLAGVDFKNPDGEALAKVTKPTSSGKGYPLSSGLASAAVSATIEAGSSFLL